MHDGVCLRRFKATWQSWVWWREKFLAISAIGFMSAVPLYFISENMYFLMGVALGVPALSAMAALVCRDRAPFQVYELGDGSVHRFKFRTASYAHDFAQGNSNRVAEEY